MQTSRENGLTETVDKIPDQLESHLTSADDSAVAGSPLPVLEIGIVIAGEPDTVDVEAVRIARDDFEEQLRAEFPVFDWHVQLVQRPEIPSPRMVEPVMLLEHGSQERDSGRRDFGFVITPSELRARYRPFAFAAIARSLDLAVISTARLDPRMSDITAEENKRRSVICRRLLFLLKHSLGHLSGVIRESKPGHDETSNDVMRNVESPEDLDCTCRFADMQTMQMIDVLQEVADVRVEETPEAGRQSRGLLFLKACRVNRHEVLDAVWQAEPWKFPLRLGRLTTASVSSMALLMLTAETWELAFSQSAWSITVLLLVSLFVTTAYVVARQRLLVRRGERRMTEQIAVSNAAASLIVFCGMATMAALLFVLTTMLGVLLFSPSLIAGWTGAEMTPHRDNWLLMSGLVSSFGILIGALGASFEDSHHFRHVTLIDEET